MESPGNKYSNFSTEPMGEKPILDLPGIGKTLAIRLQRAGFDKAYEVLGQYLLLKKNDDLFQEWLKLNFHASSTNANDCCICLHEWCDDFL